MLTHPITLPPLPRIEADRSTAPYGHARVRRPIGAHRMREDILTVDSATLMAARADMWR